MFLLFCNQRVHFFVTILCCINNKIKSRVRFYVSFTRCFFCFFLLFASLSLLVMCLYPNRFLIGRFRSLKLVQPRHFSLRCMCHCRKVSGDQITIKYFYNLHKKKYWTTSPNSSTLKINYNLILKYF